MLAYCVPLYSSCTYLIAKKVWNLLILENPCVLNGINWQGSGFGHILVITTTTNFLTWFIELKVRDNRNIRQPRTTYTKPPQLTPYQQSNQHQPMPYTMPCHVHCQKLWILIIHDREFEVDVSDLGTLWSSSKFINSKIRIGLVYQKLNSLCPRHIKILNIIG